MKFWLISGLLITMLIAALPVGYAQELDSAPVTLGGYGRINAAAWSPDGSQIAVSTQSGVVLYDADLNETAYWRPPPEVKAGGKLAWSPDGMLLAIGNGMYPAGHNGTHAVVWDVRSQQIVHSLSVLHGNPTRISDVYTIRWNHTGDRVLFATEYDQIARRFLIWEAATNTVRVHDVSAEGFWIMYDWAWSADDTRIEGVFAAPSPHIIRDQHVQINPETGAVVERWTIEPSTVGTSPDGQYFAVTRFDDGGNTSQLKIFTGDEIRVAFGEADPSEYQRLHGFAWAADSQQIVAWRRGGTPNVFVGDVLTGEIVFELSFAETGVILDVLFSPASDRLLVATADNDLLLYDLATGERIAQCWLAGGAAALSFSPAGDQLVTVGGEQRVYLWDARSGAELDTLVPPLEPLNMYSPQPFSAVAWSPDGTLIATGSTTRMGPFSEDPADLLIDLTIWDAAHREIVQVVAVPGRWEQSINTLEWSADSRVLVSARGDWAGGLFHRIDVWDAAAGGWAFQMPYDIAGSDFALHPNGQWLVFAALGYGDHVTGLYVLDIANGQVARSDVAVDGDWPYALDWHPSSEYVATLNYLDEGGAVVTVLRWQPDQPRSLVSWFSFEVASCSSVPRLEWNPARDEVALVYDNGPLLGVQIWQVDLADQDAELSREYAFERDDVLLLTRRYTPTLAWSPDGTRLAVSLTLGDTIIFEP